MKNTKNIVIGLFVLISMLVFVSASGIVSPYGKQRQLEMAPGESKIVDLNLQNMVGSEDITVKVEIKQGGDIATLEKDTFTAEAGTYDTTIPVLITLPRNYNKQIQEVTLDIKAVTSEVGSGMVNLGTGWMVSFNVVITEKPVKSSTWAGIITGLVLVILILAIVIFTIIKRKKK